MIKLHVPTIILHLSISFFVATTICNAQGYKISGEITPHHVPLVSSSLYLDTTISNFRPSASLTGQDWLLDGSYDERISTSVAAGANAEKTSVSFKEMLQSMPPEFTSTELKLPKGWSGLAIHASPFTDEPGRAMVMVEREMETIITVYSGIRTQKQLDKLITSMALFVVSDEDKQANIPFELDFPEEWPYVYTGKTVIGSHAYQHPETEATYSIAVNPQRESTAESLGTDEASFLKERPEALIDKSQGNLLMYSYDEKERFSPLWTSLTIGSASITMYGDVMPEDDRIVLLEVLRTAKLK